MGFSYLAKLGAVPILHEAANTVEEHGLSTSVPYNIFTGEISATTALAVACGAIPTHLKAWDGDIETVPVPDAYYGLFRELLGFVEAFIDADIDEWSIGKTAMDVARQFRKSADKIEISFS